MFTNKTTFLTFYHVFYCLDSNKHNINIISIILQAFLLFLLCSFSVQRNLKCLLYTYAEVKCKTRPSEILIKTPFLFQLFPAQRRTGGQLVGAAQIVRGVLVRAQDIGRELNNIME